MNNEDTKKLIEDVSYMRGQWDATMPRMIVLVSDHEKRIDDISKEQGILATKIAMIGAAAGTVGAAVAKFLSTHLNIHIL